MLSAIAKLNPHVDMKKIVIGLMDRLSNYATRDNEDNSMVKSRQQAEEEATARLLERVRLSKQSNEATQNSETGQPESQQDGTERVEDVNKPDTGDAAESQEPPKEIPTNGEAADSNVNLPHDIKLYEIFYDQVVNLVKTRGMPIQDTIALLVSLAKLAL